MGLPTIALTARISVLQVRSDGPPDYVDRPNPIAFIWPSGLTDSGAVPLAPIPVAANVPAGATTCVRVLISLAGQPDFILGSESSCRNKQP